MLTEIQHQAHDDVQCYDLKITTRSNDTGSVQDFVPSSAIPATKNLSFGKILREADDEKGMSQRQALPTRQLQWDPATAAWLLD